MSSLLVRYKRPGGFLQLVKLLEGFGKEKKEKFLSIVEQEDPNWAGALESKLLTIDKIFSWKDDPLHDVVRTFHKKNMAAVLHGMSTDIQDRVLGLMSDTTRKHLSEQMEIVNPTPSEIAASMVVMIEEIREMIEKKYLKLEVVDPSLVIPDDIEEDLASGALFLRREKKTKPENEVPARRDRSTVNSSDDAAVQFAATKYEGTISAHELELLKRKIINLTKEVTLLKKENEEMAAKLEQIRKIA
jgi:hypothetical protein